MEIIPPGYKPCNTKTVTDDMICMKNNVVIRKSKLHTLYELFGSCECSVSDVFDKLNRLPGYGLPELYNHMNYLVDRGYATCENKFHLDGQRGKARYYKFVVPEENWKI